MSALHEALTTLSPVEWSDVPQDNPAPFMKQIFEAGEVICNSIPPPPGGSNFSESTPTQTTPDAAKSAQDIVASDARPTPPHSDHVELQKAWGKPMKLGQKDNALGITVYKMAAKDRHGAWFARRSVHEGISFTKMRRAMQREFPESLSCQGGPGDGNVRGIGGDRKLEKKEVDGVGKIEAYQLSAQFPGPTTPREFITLLVTSEEALSEKTSQDHIPRHFMVVSKPLTHPDAPDRTGFVKGYYESVEMIREIPLNRAPGKNSDSKDNKHELNPVEWIMITRSDPGGGIPRFMVERGTPSSICGDTVKFLNWACAKDVIPDADADEDKIQEAAAANVERQQTTAASTAPTAAAQPRQQTQQQGGIMSSLTTALEAGIEAYAPASVANYAQGYLHQDQYGSDSSSSSSSSSSSANSFASAKDYHSEAPNGNGNTTAQRNSTVSLGSASLRSANIDNASHHEKELRKIDQNAEKLEQKIAKKRETENEKLEAAREKDPSDCVKAQEKHDKEMRKLEEKRQKELEKLEHKKEKEIQKAQKKRQKNLEKDEVSRVARERDNFKTQLDVLKRENGSLREQAADLGRENEMLVDRVNKLGGEDALKAIREDAVKKAA